jgi:hypothetical protein
MKLTGLPSPRRLIMMFRPALRTSHSAFCGLSAVISTTLPGRPSVAHQLGRAAQLRQQRASSPANSTSRIASGSPISADSIDGPERRIGARQLDHRAVDQLDRGRAEL